MEHEVANPLTHQLKIGVDIDNTISDSTPKWWKEFEKEFSEKIIYRDTLQDIYHLEKYTTATHQEVQVFTDRIEGDPSFILSLPAYKGANIILNKWILEGHKLHYITARPSHSRASTLAWLKKHDFPTENVSLDLHDRERDTNAVSFKARVVKSFKIDLMIEDSLEIAMGLPITTLLIDNTWNQGKLPARITRVSNWKEIESWVKRYSGGKTRGEEAF